MHPTSTPLKAFLLLSLFWVAQAPTLHAEAPITEGVVQFDIEYEDVGAMAAMLPKTERLYFRPGQVRIESGTQVSLRGVVPGKTVQMMEVGALKLAFLLPAAEDTRRNEMLRFESLDGHRTVADLEARQVDGVDREDETNRLTYWVSDRVEADFFAIEALPAFALEYSTAMEDGLAHRTATRIEAKTVDADLFAVPEDFEQIEIDSPRDIGRHLGERLGGNVRVME